jgi:hypothetical protein
MRCASKRYSVAVATVPVPSAACRALFRQPAPPHPIAQPVLCPVVARVSNHVAVWHVATAVHAGCAFRRGRVLRVLLVAKPPAAQPHNNSVKRTCRLRRFAPSRHSAYLQRYESLRSLHHNSPVIPDADAHLANVVFLTHVGVVHELAALRLKGSIAHH